ncbi:hypothetical protein SAMN04488511_11431 [Pedobacter suwonensis]|uniref:Uncharacterized protein n=1 Tax=Pedobacter suwonensis TaxID=332999 RepID=A0A1I0TT46_9SPHI|nr:hypothetical protein [Pedobacter suwonensis]SFA54867.1 hypothetical protein SAMN04488511_11431 [Pedobacter suwonensis]
MYVVQIYLAHPTSKQQGGVVGWNGANWVPRKNLGKFLIDVAKPNTKLMSDSLTLIISKNTSESFIFGYSIQQNIDKPFDKEFVNWKHCFLVIEYLGKSGVNALIAPAYEGVKVKEGDSYEISLSRLRGDN